MRNPWDNVALGENMPEHLVPADLDRLVRGKLSGPEKRLMVGHLLKHCPHCCGALARYGGMAGTLPIKENDYDGAVNRAVRRVMSNAALAAIAALLADDPASHRKPSAELAALKGLPRVQTLIQAARALRHQDPQAMLRYAQLARRATDRLRACEYGRRPVADLRALVWAELASAYRVCNELGQADHAMSRAIYWCRRGSQADLLLARVADLLASLLAYQRRFPEGQQLLTLVYEVHAESGNRHLAGRALVSQGNLAAWEGFPRKAILLMAKGFNLLDQDRDPLLAAQTAWSLLWTLSEFGRFRTARRLLWRSRSMFARVVESHRLSWLEGRIYAGLSDHARAEAAFQQARAGFAERGQVYPAALVGLDLAALWVRQHRLKDVFDLAEEMVVTFRALRIAREAVVALLILKRACVYGGYQIMGVIDMAADFLRDLERQPARPRPYSGSPPAPPPPGSALPSS
jgi:tetratricopeptide (TPR) repeat protein